MEPISTTAIAAFLSACLYKAGEKFSEKAIETVFENKKELADGFTNLFGNEIITLGLNNVTTSAEAQQKLEAQPEIAQQALQKLNENPQLLKDFNQKLREHTSGVTINAEKIGQFIKENYGTINVGGINM